MNLRTVFCLGFAAATLAGCGYSSELLLPEHIQNIHVAKVRNAINLTEEISSTRAFSTYRPGLEVEVRNAVIRRFIFDGHLKVSERDNADAVLRMELTDFRRDPLRYNADESIQEFRVHVVVQAKVTDVRDGSIIWSGSASGNASYFLSGPRAISEDEAVAGALEDLSRRIVENVLEVW